MRTTLIEPPEESPARRAQRAASPLRVEVIHEDEEYNYSTTEYSFCPPPPVSPGPRQPQKQLRHLELPAEEQTPLPTPSNQPSLIDYFIPDTTLAVTAATALAPIVARFGSRLLESAIAYSTGPVQTIDPPALPRSPESQEPIMSGRQGSSIEGRRQESEIPLPLHQDQNLTLENIATLLKQQLDPIRQKVNRLEEANDPASDRRKELERQKIARKLAHEKFLADCEKEIQSISDRSWTSPTTVTDAPVVIFSPNSSHQPSNMVRFNVKSLPTFKYGDDVDLWMTEMDHLVRLWGEKVVCPHIFANCFVQGDIVRNWYTGLGTIWQQAITEDEGCWKRFSAAVRSKWSISEGIRQTKADDRRKNPNETYTEYGMNKIQMLRFAYQDASESSLIQKARRGLDRDADRYCREYSSIDRFYDELVRYDEGEARNDTRSSYSFSKSNRSQSQYKDSISPREQYSNRQYENPFKDKGFTNQQTLTRPQQPSRTNMLGQGTGRRDADDRKATVMDRMNPETRKMTRSFLDRKGVTRFLERPCDKCSTEASPKNHFRFECPNDTKSSTFLSSTQDTSENLKILTSPYTLAPTSYTFSSNASAYVPIINYPFDNGFDSDDEEYNSENEERGQ